MLKDLNNLTIAELLRDVSAALQIKDPAKNKFRIIAYDNAATAIEHLSGEAKDLSEEGKLEEVSGIGASIAENLRELFEKGQSKHFDDILAGIPKAVFSLMEVSGIGPKTAYKLVKEFNISDHDPRGELKKLASDGRIRELPGFGEQSESEILKSLTEYKEKSARILLAYAEGKAQEIIAYLHELDSVKQIDVLGSLRRKVSTVGDIDLAVITTDPRRTINHFVNYPRAKRVLEKGEKKAAIIIPPSVQVDLRVQDKDSYGSLLQHFTGSKFHNIALREYALKKGLSLSEYGIAEKTPPEKPVRTFADEKSFYGFLGLEYIPPELREDMGEIEAAKKKDLPQLVELSDIKTDFHVHSDFDVETSHDLGGSSMETILARANQLGYEYISFTEHNPSQRGHDSRAIVEILKRKREKIDHINYSIARESANSGSVRKVFNSLEIDILPDGRLPVSEEALATLDFAIVSLHSSFRQPVAEMTDRVLSALALPKVKIFAHPTARILLKREGVELDWDKVLDFCIKNNTWLEINADPARLDLPEQLVREAVRANVKLTLGTDAHHVSGLANMTYGVYTARRGWAEADDIINTVRLDQFEKLLSRGGDR